MDDGWIKLHRKIRKHWLYTEPRKFSRLEAWIDLLLKANFFDNEVCMDGEVSIIKRGAFITSLKMLGAAWGWSNTKVKAFLELLEQEGMINYKSDTKKTFINIVNYCLYQDEEIEKTYQKHIKNISETHQKHTNKKEEEREKKNNTAAKISFGDFVAMTNAEYEKLCGTYGEEDAKRMIEVLDNYKGATGRKYKSDYRAVLSWVVERVLGSSRRPVAVPNAKAYKAEEDKCPLCHDSGWVVDEGGEMVRCKCTGGAGYGGETGRCSCQGGDLDEASSQ